MTPDIQAQLAQLRDIRAPQEVGFWPLAPGWWMLALVFGLAIAGIVCWRVLRRYSARSLALAELDALPKDDPRHYATELSILLRRVARRKNEAVTRLSGKNWSDYLASTGLKPSCAQYLAEATYAAEPAVTATSAELQAAAATWIRTQT